MFAATKGINTHKGAIVALALLCSAAGRLLAMQIDLTRERICAEVAAICTGLVSRELESDGAAQTAGERIFCDHGLAGARGEAASGFLTVRSLALPVYDRVRRAGNNEEMALLESLLHLLVVNADTNLISRGGLAGMEHMRGYARTLVLQGGAWRQRGSTKW